MIVYKSSWSTLNLEGLQHTNSRPLVRLSLLSQAYQVEARSLSCLADPTPPKDWRRKWLVVDRNVQMAYLW